MPGASKKRKRGLCSLPPRSVLLVCRSEDREWSERIAINGRNYQVDITVIVIAFLSKLEITQKYNVVVLGAPHGSSKDACFWWSQARTKSSTTMFGDHPDVRDKTSRLPQHISSWATQLVFCTCFQGLYLSKYRSFLDSDSQLILCGWDYDILYHYPKCDTWISRGCRLCHLRANSHLGKHVVVNKL